MEKKQVMGEYRGKISRDTPLAEITLRRYEKPVASERELVRKFCLSIGLLQPGDSRDVVVDVLQVMLKARQRGQELHSEEIKNFVMEERRRLGMPLLGIASSNIRRQLKRIKDLHLIETRANLYRITEFAELRELFEEKVESFMLKSVLGRIKEYLRKLDDDFPSIHRTSVQGPSAHRLRGSQQPAERSAEDLEFSEELLHLARHHRD